MFIESIDNGDSIAEMLSIDSLLGLNTKLLESSDCNNSDTRLATLKEDHPSSEKLLSNSK